MCILNFTDHPIIPSSWVYFWLLPNNSTKVAWSIPVKTSSTTYEWLRISARHRNQRKASKFRSLCSRLKQAKLEKVLRFSEVNSYEFGDGQFRPECYDRISVDIALDKNFLWAFNGVLGQNVSAEPQVTNRRCKLTLHKLMIFWRELRNLQTRKYLW